jgi:hypothetical protein
VGKKKVNFNFNESTNNSKSIYEGCLLNLSMKVVCLFVTLKFFKTMMPVCALLLLLESP